VSGLTSDEIQVSLHEHLAWWGLRHVESDAAYFAWQKEIFTPQELATLHQHIEDKRLATAGPSAEIDFYDLTAQPRWVPALYSQRYEYYLQVGSRVARQLHDATSVLDVGCGIGILTTFYAQQHPNCAVLGVDRSPGSIDLARQRGQKLGLANLRFECLDIDHKAFAGDFDVIIATHTLLQAEQDPGLPSRDWSTFERSADTKAQQQFEGRTGLGVRLDRLRAGLMAQGRMIVFEKTRQLARRVPFQRALAARGLHMLAPPEPVRYRSVEEVTDDGPLYGLSVTPPETVLAWDELPEPDEGPMFDPHAPRPVSAQAEEPLYENHASSAEQAWLTLPDKQVLEQATEREPDGRQLHVERGRAAGLHYLYCANTYDQRQLVIIEPARAAILETYYREITSDMQNSGKRRL
jgi:SAM-dependent methyltransferase